MPTQEVDNIPNQDIHPLFRYRRTPGSGPSRIEIRAGEAAHAVPRSIFGNFLGHLGFAVHGGVSAQLLANPALCTAHNLQPADLAKLPADGRRLAQGRAGLPPELPRHWQPDPFDFVEPGPQWSFVCADGQWHQALFDCDELSFIALHALPENARGMESASDAHAHAALMAHPLAWERDDLPALLTQAAAAGQPQVRLAITEWGVLGWSDTRPRVDNYGEVPYAGLFLNLLIRNAPQIPVANATALLHGGCIRKAAERLFFDAQYYALQLYTQPDAARALAVQLTGPGHDVTGGTETTPAVADIPYLDAAACLTEDNRTLHVFIVNRHLSETLPAELHLDGFPAASAVEQALMTAPCRPGPPEPARSHAEPSEPALPDYAAVASPWAPDAFAPERTELRVEGDVVQLALPPFSLSRLTIRRREG